MAKALLELPSYYSRIGSSSAKKILKSAETIFSKRAHEKKISS